MHNLEYKRDHTAVPETADGADHWNVISKHAGHAFAFDEAMPA